MNKTTNISWAGWTWNPLAGCELASPGCTNCYAMKVAAREAAKGIAKFENLTKEVNGKMVWNGNINIARERVLNEPFRRKEPSLVFVNSMSDLFYEGVSDTVVFDLMDRMREADWHKYLILTKRAERMKRLVDTYCITRGLDRLPDCFWMGVSVEDNKRAKARIPYLADTRAAVRFVSMEPLLEAIDLTELPVVEWYIVGGESVELDEDPATARPFDPAWALETLAWTREVGAAFHFKQFGCNPVGMTLDAFKGDDKAEFPEAFRVQEYPA